MWVCIKCQKRFKDEDIDEHNIRCHYCGNRILQRETPPIAHKVGTE
ncbi:DNA-directed RNA polymerase subunit P [Candidatus Micrarchaeota archaeon]|nr:DNA-directed RNA polymerase subunit P [Candidatus Micrarchaeota archaeon]